jgi:hypothetical protein
MKPCYQDARSAERYLLSLRIKNFYPLIALICTDQEDLFISNQRESARSAERYLLSLRIKSFYPLIALICADKNDLFISSISVDLRDLRKDIFCL